MSELRDEIFTDDFPAYRQKEIEAAIDVISDFVKRGENADYINGAMNMFRKILNVPVDVAKTKEQKEFIRRRIDEDFAKFSIEYLRRALRDE